ncbi:hypothetical protein QOT17_017937 [Balamuthia mandrillaris]
MKNTAIENNEKNGKYEKYGPNFLFLDLTGFCLHALRWYDVVAHRRSQPLQWRSLEWRTVQQCRNVSSYGLPRASGGKEMGKRKKRNNSSAENEGLRNGCLPQRLEARNHEVGLVVVMAKHKGNIVKVTLSWMNSIVKGRCAINCANNINKRMRMPYRRPMNGIQVGVENRSDVADFTANIQLGYMKQPVGLLEPVYMLYVGVFGFMVAGVRQKHNASGPRSCVVDLEIYAKESFVKAFIVMVTKSLETTNRAIEQLVTIQQQFLNTLPLLFSGFPAASTQSSSTTSLTSLSSVATPFPSTDALTTRPATAPPSPQE